MASPIPISTTARSSFFSFLPSFNTFTFRSSTTPSQPPNDSTVPDESIDALPAHQNQDCDMLRMTQHHGPPVPAVFTQTAHLGLDTHAVDELPIEAATPVSIAPSAASSELSSAPQSPTLSHIATVTRAMGSSSPLSSPASLSPSPPPAAYFDYPSPLPSQDSESASSHQGSPCPDNNRMKRPQESQGPPPAKRRRITEPKVRKTEHLDLIGGSLDSEDQIQLDRLLNVLHRRQKVIVVAGAGISVSAGIPDFRSATGLFANLKREPGSKTSARGKELFDASVYGSDESTGQFHDLVRTLHALSTEKKPTVFHHLLATMAQQDRLLRLYTQNVDCLDTQLPPLATEMPLKPKGPWPKAIQAHGNVMTMVCSKCQEITALDPELFRGSDTPPCNTCVEADTLRTEHAGKRSHGIGRLRPRMVLYNEHNPDDEAIGAVMESDLKKRPDALIVVGTTLKIPGMIRLVREACKIIKGRKDGEVIWIGPEGPPKGPKTKDIEWDLIVRSSSDEVARQAHMSRWDQPDVEMPAEPRSQPSPRVLIPSPVKSLKNSEQGIPTPLPSPRHPPKTLFQRSIGAAILAPSIEVPVQNQPTGLVKLGQKVAKPTTKKATAPRKTGAKGGAAKAAKPTKQKGALRNMLGVSKSGAAEISEVKETKVKAAAPARSHSLIPLPPLAAFKTRTGIPKTPAATKQSIPHEASKSSSPEDVLRELGKVSPRTPRKVMKTIPPSDARINRDASPPRPLCSPITDRNCYVADVKLDPKVSQEVRAKLLEQRKLPQPVNLGTQSYHVPLSTVQSSSGQSSSPTTVYGGLSVAKGPKKHTLFSHSQSKRKHHDDSSDDETSSQTMAGESIAEMRRVVTPPSKPREMAGRSIID